MVIIARINENSRTIGYIAKDRDNQYFIDIKDTYKYEPTNVVRLKNGMWRAKANNHIKTLDKKDMQNINDIIGKHKMVCNYTFDKPSLIQRKILDRLKINRVVIIDKKRENIKVTMRDLSVFTAITGIEYALFERNDKYVIIRGTNINVYVDKSNISKLINGKYTWVGHTHPGDTFNCLIPSDGDYAMLQLFCQQQSTIYNSAGQYYVFGKE